MKKLVLVTGGAGFVGSNLVKRLVEAGHSVIVLDNYFTGSADTQVAGVDYRKGHTRDIAKLVPEKPDLIYHLGEYARVEQSLKEPEVVWDANVAGTFAVIEYWRALNTSDHACKLVYAGSSTKFGDGGLARVATPYAWTKAANTELIKNYGSWYRLPFAITYFYNVYGPGERAGKYGTVIEIFRQLRAAGKPITVTSPGTQKRNFTHVNDIVEGLVLVGEKGEGEEYGLGDERKYSILEIAQLFGGTIEMLPERPGNRMESAIDTTKSKALGWSVQHSVTEYIRTVVAGLA